MGNLTKLARTLSLVMLSGGSAAIVFAAIVLVKAAKAKGIPVEEAAANNAPLFIQYSRIVLGSAIILLLSEIVDLVSNKSKTKLTQFRYICSFVAIATGFAFALGIVPPLEELLPTIQTSAEAHAKFHHLHEISRAIFGISIAGAFAALILPLFEKSGSTESTVVKVATPVETA